MFPKRVFIQLVSGNPPPPASNLVPFSLITMDSEISVEWSAYSTVLYSAQRPPPLGTVNTDEKLAQMAKEHLIKVANEGPEHVQLPSNRGSN